MNITVRDAVLTAAEMLGLDESVRAYLDGESNPEGEEDTKRLLSCFQTVENELALDYLPLTAEEIVVTADGRIPYAQFTRSIAQVLCVEDEWGDSLKYKLFPAHLETQAGKVRVFYAYTPAKKTLEDASDFQTGASLRLFGYGIAAEYALAAGELTSASAWDVKYKNAIRAAYRIRPCKKIKSRRWV